MVKVLKGLAEYSNMTLGQLLEKIVLHSFEPVPGQEGEMAASPYSKRSLEVIADLKRIHLRHGLRHPRQPPLQREQPDEPSAERPGQSARCGDESGSASGASPAHAVARRAERAERVARQERTAASRVSRLAVSDEKSGPELEEELGQRRRRRSAPGAR